MSRSAANTEGCIPSHRALAHHITHFVAAFNVAQARAIGINVSDLALRKASGHLARHPVFTLMQEPSRLHTIAVCNKLHNSSHKDWYFQYSCQIHLF